jgi:hypothetical protein
LTERHPRTLAATLAVALAGALLVGGCGGGGSSSTDTGGSQPVDQLISQADAICSDADGQRPPAPALDTNPSLKSLRSTVGYFEKDLELTQQTLNELSDLAPPQGLEDEWATVLAGFKAVTTNYPDLIAAAKAGDGKAFLHVVEKIQKDAKDLRPAAAKIGLQVCATG